MYVSIYAMSNRGWGISGACSTLACDPDLASQALPQHHVQHPFSDIFTFSPHPNIFAGFVWKYRTSITHNGILEDYRVITPTQQVADVVQLVRTYLVYHSWHENSVTVSFA